MEYDKDYYEHGIESGKSCYQNYRWIPELTIPMAMTIIDFLKIEKDQTILDYGCAKGFLVKAFRLLHRKAWGVDLSSYAISCSEKYCSECSGDGKLPYTPWKYDWCIAKDVFEHVDDIDSMAIILKNLSLVTNKIFAVIPLGSNGKFTANANNVDKTHTLCMNKRDWTGFFGMRNWTVKNFTYRVDGIKDAYYDKDPRGHGFFTLSKEG